MSTKDRIKQILKDCCAGNASLATDILHEEFVIIDRQDLPTVTMDGNRAEAGTCSRGIRDDKRESLTTAVSLLAIHEFIASEGWKVRNKRRDELASEFTAVNSYNGQLPYTQKLIDRIIDLEAAK